MADVISELRAIISVAGISEAMSGLRGLESASRAAAQGLQKVVSVNEMLGMSKPIDNLAAAYLGAAKTVDVLEASIRRAAAASSQFQDVNAMLGGGRTERASTTSGAYLGTQSVVQGLSAAMDQASASGQRLQSVSQMLGARDPAERLKASYLGLKTSMDSAEVSARRLHDTLQSQSAAASATKTTLDSSTASYLGIKQSVDKTSAAYLGLSSSVRSSATSISQSNSSIARTTDHVTSSYLNIPKNPFAALESSASRFAPLSRSMGSNVGRINQAVSQASFGLQDFAVTIGQGGLGMAMRSASNNAAQMAFILGHGGIAGAAAGLGLTIASLIPDMIHMFKGGVTEAKKLELQLDRLQRRFSRLEFEVEFTRKGRTREQQEMLPDIDLQQQINRKLAGGKDSGLIGDVERRLLTQSKNRFNVVSDIQSAQQEKRNTLTEFVNSLSREQRMAVATQIVQPGYRGIFTAKGAKAQASGQLADVMKAISEGRADEVNIPLLQNAIRQARTAKGKVMFSATLGSKGPMKGEEIKPATEAFKKLNEKIVESDRKLKEYRQTLESINRSISRLKGQVPQAREAEATEKSRMAAWEDFNKFLKDSDKATKESEQKTKKDRSEKLKGIEEQRKAERELLKTTDPIGAGLQEIDEKFKKIGETLSTAEIARGGGISEVSQIGVQVDKARMKARQDFLDKSQPGITGSFGVADFSRQLQNALLKDDTNKMIQHNTDAIKKNTADSVKRLDEINKGIANLKSAKGVFGP